jgi:hypothetical protein
VEDHLLAIGNPLGSGVFGDSGQSLGIHDSLDVSLGDLDGDGDLDAFVANRRQGNRVWLNRDGMFSDSGQVLGNHRSYSVSLGDLDADGDLDAFVANDREGNRIWFNNGGVFVDSKQVLGNHRSFSVSLGDLDGDGDLDAFVANADHHSNRVWLNNGGVFIDSGQTLGNHSSTGVSLGDLDGDGDLDAFVANSINQGNRVWLNNENGVFTGNGQSLGNHYSFLEVALGDLDEDGDLDAFVVNRFQGNRVWLNNAGMFTDSGQILGNRDRRDVAIGDLDGDGDLDAFVANRLQDNRVWLNDGGVFTPNGQVMGDHSSQGVALGDLDGDGDLDAFVANSSNHGNRVWLNLQGNSLVEVATSDADKEEGHSGTTPFTFEVRRTGDTSGAASVSYAVIGSGINPADAADFGGALPSGIVNFAIGETSQAITIDVAGDAVIEADEEFTVTLSRVAATTHITTASAIGTIQNDDDTPSPAVTLTLDSPTIAEATGVATITATLSITSTQNVIVDLDYTGTAAFGVDYIPSRTQIEISPGSQTGTVTVTAIQDLVDEDDETIIVDIASVTNGTESGTQTATITIIDDDGSRLSVTSLVPTGTGFVVEFSNELDVSTLNLYDTQTAGLGSADVVLQGSAGGQVAGSMVVDGSARTITFIKTGDPLAPDTYMVTLRSADDAFKNSGGQFLDGDGDGTAGGDFRQSITVMAPDSALVVSLPDFVRGPGQAVNLPAPSEQGIPISLDESAGVRAIDLQISYDPSLLNISGAVVGPGMPSGASVLLNNLTPGLAILSFFSPTVLPAGPNTFVNLQANVPTAAASEIYGKNAILDIHSVTIRDSNNDVLPVIVDDALHLVSYFADVSGNGRINASDAAQVARFAALIDTGFSASLLSDPIVVGDISGNRRVNAADASRVAQFAALIDVPEIPPIPVGVLGAGAGGAQLGPGLPGFAGAAQKVNRRSALPTRDADSADTTDRESISAIVGQQFPPAVDRVMVDFGKRLPSGSDDDLFLGLEDAIEKVLTSSAAKRLSR